LAAGGGQFTEPAAWITGETHFLAAQAKGRRMPILFGATDTAAALVCYAFLTRIEINESDPAHPQTTYTFTDPTPISGHLPLSTLILGATRQPLSDQSHRHYANCFTPAFLIEQAHGGPQSEQG
jgi:hypothetical protein